MGFTIKQYTDEDKEEWDAFIYRSMNGTFLQTREFINYHPQGRFSDCSLLIYKGKTIVACILACEIMENNEKVFFSHKGTSYGGIIISKSIYNTSNVMSIMEMLESYLKNEKYNKVYFKMVPAVFSRENTDLLDYFLYQRGYAQYDELNFYMHLENYKDDILQSFSTGKRRDYRYSLRNNLLFKQLAGEEEIKEFYDVLQLNLKKLGLKSVHTYEELVDLKRNRFDDNIEFYGVYYGAKMIAGSMVFLFDNQVLHTQYLSSDEKYLEFYPMDFLIYHLIEIALEKKMRLFTFGICTENQGKYLNLGLARFKEGFGAKYCINRSYEKKL